MEERIKPELQNVRADHKHKAAVCWTGGKDCHLALLQAWRDPSVHVTALVSFQPENAVFHAHPIRFMDLQAEAIGLPLHRIIILKDTTDYRAAYVAGIRRMRDEHGIDKLVTGDMDLVGNMKQNWIKECCDIAGVSACLPLWQADRQECLQKLLNEQFEIIYTCVKSPWFDASWIGRQVNEDAIREMTEISALTVVNGGVHKVLDLGGERGEYHTMCLDGPIYKHRIDIAPPTTEELHDQSGQKDGQRWWVLKFS